MSVIEHLWRGRRVRVTGAVDQIRVDCPEDLAAIYHEYWDLVYRRCLATLHDELAAEDATQDVFLLALDNFEQVQDDIVRGLLDIARTISYERRRRPAREVSLPNPERVNGHGHRDDPADIAERNGVLDAVWSGLSPLERRYVADKFAGFTFEEIAERNGRKLGTVSSNLFRAREHARTLRGRTLPALLGAAGWRRLTDLARRGRNAAHSSAVSAGAQPVQSLTLSLTVMGLIAGVAPAATAAEVAVAPRAEAMAPAPSGPAGSDTTAVVGIAAAAPRATEPYAPAPRSTSNAAPALPLGSGSAAAETPEDTVIYTATPSPNYQRDHTILGLGYGRSCACNVLLRSTDGGATWVARSGAPDGKQIVLPPDYPQDGSIFVGQASGVTGSSDWWAKGFDQPFNLLPLPPGPLALPAGFDAGDPRVIASASSGVWSYDTGSGVVTPLVVETSRGAAPALATPLGALETGVLAMTSSQAVTPGSPARAAAASTSLTLWACPPGQECTAHTQVPLPVGAFLAAAPDFATDPMLVAYSVEQAIVSQNGGTSFSSLALPAGVKAVESIVFGSGPSGASMWLVAHRGGSIILELAPSIGGTWHEVDDGLPQITGKVGTVVPLGLHRVMYLSGDGGFVCTNDDGGHWSSRCPAA